MRALLGAEAADFLAAAARPPALGLRVNTLKVAPADLAARLPYPTEPVPWCPEGLTVPAAAIASGEARPGLHPYHFAGLYYVQDSSAMAAAVLLDPRPGEWVLDLCAAPGGKATHLAARMGNRGFLAANEVDRRRATALASNAERLGVTNAVILCEAAERLAERWAGRFDRVLVDAPCSGEGMFGRSPEAARLWSPRLVAGCAARQGRLLGAAAALVKPGGRLLYATCTFAPEENEEVVVAFLAAHPDFDLVEPPRPPGFDRGRPDWVRPGRPGRGDPRLERAVRLWPHRAPGHGHFYALFRREEGARPAGRAGGKAPASGGARRGGGGGRAARGWPVLPAEVARALEEFWRAHLEGEVPAEGLFFLAGRAQLYRTPVPPGVWEGLRVLRPGWWLGRLRRGRFEPDHALLMALPGAAVRRRLDLPPDDPRLAGFLRGESVTGPWPGGEGGLGAVTVDGFPLGWALAEGGEIRSLVPRPIRQVAWESLR